MRQTRARWIALAATLIDLALGIVLWANYDIGGPQWQFTESCAAVRPGFSWALGIDGIALMLIVLTVFLMPICIGASWDIDREARRRIYGGLPAHGSADDRRVLRRRICSCSTSSSKPA